MHWTSEPAELETALRESAPDPYRGTPLGVETAWYPNGIDVPQADAGGAAFSLPEQLLRTRS